MSEETDKLETNCKYKGTTLSNLSCLLLPQITVKCFEKSLELVSNHLNTLLRCYWSLMHFEFGSTEMYNTKKTFL